MNRIWRVSAIVKGKRSVINEMKKTGLTATVDVADASEGKNRGKVELELPSGVTLDSISDDTISYRVEKSIEVKKTVEIDFVGDAGNDKDLVPWAYDMYPDTVTVTGAESVVNEVDAVRGKITSNVVSESPKTVEVELMAVKKDGTEMTGCRFESLQSKDDRSSDGDQRCRCYDHTEKHGKRERSGFHQWRGFCESRGNIGSSG